jgi:hypothetical protein
MQGLAAVRRVLDDAGLLLQHDAKWPSVSTIVAGQPVRGSWWGHPAGHAIFDVLQAVGDDVLGAKLLAGKQTLVHRRLWPALAGVGRARQPWQVRGLAADAADVLALVDTEGEIDSDDIELTADCRKLSAIVTDLERRLLLLAEPRHTDSGKHVRVLRSWAHLPGRPSSSAKGRAALEAAVERLAGPDARTLLPWS